jgi:hypothetical protein
MLSKKDVVAHLRCRLSQNSAQVLTSAVANAAVLERGFIELNLPPYSSGLDPSDYFLFAKLERGLRGNFTKIEK